MHLTKSAGTEPWVLYPMMQCKSARLQRFYEIYIISFTQNWIKKGKYSSCLIYDSWTPL